jgi:hypothetical protein
MKYRNKFNYFEGIRYDSESEQLTIDLAQDLDNDLVKTKLQNFNKKLSTRSGFGAYVAYKLEPNSSNIPSFDKILKNDLLNTNGGLEMIKKSVLSFNKLVPINTFDVILYPKSSSDINKVIAKFIESKSSSNTLNIPDSVIKNSLNNIKVDVGKLEGASPAVKKRVNQLLTNPSGKFELKKVPMAMRNMFYDFLKFDTELERELFNKLNNGKVLIIDDVYTRGTTISELAKMAFAKGASEVVVFIFLQRK